MLEVIARILQAQTLMFSHITAAKGSAMLRQLVAMVDWNWHNESSFFKCFMSHYTAFLQPRPLPDGKHSRRKVEQGTCCLKSKNSLKSFVKGNTDD